MQSRRCVDFRQAQRVVRLALLVPILAGGAASADTHTWDGSASNLWTVGANWDIGAAPVDGDDLVFPGGALNTATSNNDILGLDVNSISVTGSGYGFTGNSITLGAGGFTHIVVATTTFDIFTTLSGVTPFSVADGGTLNMGALGGTGGPTKTGLGLLSFGFATSYTGLTTVSAGRLRILNSAGLGDTTAGTVVESGGSLLLEGGNTVGAEALTLNGSGAGTPFSALYTDESINSWAGNITLGSDATIGPNGDPAFAVLTLSGTLSGADDLIKQNPGTLVLTGNNSGYTAPATTNILAGTLMVNGQLGTAVFLNGATSVLGGTGSVASTTVQSSGGTVSPGASPGILTSGNVLLQLAVFNSRFRAELNGTTAGTGYDQLAVNGAVTLGGAALDAILGYSPAVNDSFVIIANDGSDAVSGAFGGLSNNATFTLPGPGCVPVCTLRVNYDGGTGNDVVLTVTLLTPVELQSFEIE